MDKLYELKSSPGKGSGLFARADIPAGTRFISEPAFFNVPGHQASQGLDTYVIWKTFHNLPWEEKMKYLRLARNRSDTIRIHARLLEELPTALASKGDTKNGVILQIAIVASIYITNAFPAGIFLEAARLNHSCASNSIHMYHEATKRYHITASRDISAGEELTISYDAIIDDTDGRRLTLEAFGFICECEACTSDDRVNSDARRRRLRRLRDDLGFVLMKLDHERRGELLYGPDPVTVVGPKGFAAAVEEAKEIIETEASIPAQLQSLFQIAGYIASRLFELHERTPEMANAAFDWMDKAASLRKMLLGEDSVEYQTSLRAIRALEQICAKYQMGRRT